MPFADGDAVLKGSVLVRMPVPELQTKRQATLARIERLRWQAASAGFDADTRNRLLVSEETLVTAQAELASLNTELMNYAPRAPFAGHLRDVDPGLRVGQWLSRKERIGVLVRDDGRWLVETWLDEESVGRVKVGDRGLFITDGTDGASVRLTVSQIDRDASRVLPRPELAAHLGGHVLTREKSGTLVPERAIYRVEMTLDPPQGTSANLFRQSWRGQVTLRAQSEAPAWRYLRQSFAVLVREIGF